MQSWSESQRRSIEAWVADQRAAIQKERHENEKSALLIDRAQRNLSGTEFYEKKHKSERDALRATIEKLKLDKSKQEQKTQRQEKVLRERIKKMVTRIKQLEEQLLHFATSTDFNNLSRSHTFREREVISSPKTERYVGPKISPIAMNCQRADESSKNFCKECIMPTENELASSSEIFRFANGDIENLLSDGTVIYYYDEISVSRQM